MAIGSGKTFTAITSIYRMIKFGGAERVLFLDGSSQSRPPSPQGVPAVHRV
jgi:type I site-specific restriction endonuclease